MVLDNSASWEPVPEMPYMPERMPEIVGGVPMIKVVGIGGGGSNAVSRMYKDKLPVVEYYAINTDAQHLFKCDVAHRVAIGQNLTRGLGSGAQPDLGRQAAEESRAGTGAGHGRRGHGLPGGGHGWRHRYRRFPRGRPDCQGVGRPHHRGRKPALCLRGQHSAAGTPKRVSTASRTMWTPSSSSPTIACSS